jgi:hypothetical protein
MLPAVGDAVDPVYNFLRVWLWRGPYRPVTNVSLNIFVLSQSRNYRLAPCTFNVHSVIFYLQILTADMIIYIKS